VALEILGEAAGKVVISDRFKGYGWINRRQFCWAYPMRDSQAMVDRGGEPGEVGRALLSHVEKVFDQWHRGCEGTMVHATLRSHVDVRRHLIRDDLWRGEACGHSRMAAT
jgi:hypothetical protein